MATALAFTLSLLLESDRPSEPTKGQMEQKATLPRVPKGMLQMSNRNNNTLNLTWKRWTDRSTVMYAIQRGEAFPRSVIRRWVLVTCPEHQV